MPTSDTNTQPFPKRGGHDRQASMKQAEMDARKVSQALKKAQLKTPPRNVQAAALKIMSQAVPVTGVKPTLVKRTINPRESNKDSDQYLVPEHNFDGDSSNSQLVPQPEFESDQDDDNEGDDLQNDCPLRRLKRYTDRNDDVDDEIMEVPAHKRGLSVSSDADLNYPQKFQKTAETSSDGRACRRDFRHDVQDVIKKAQILLKVKLYMVNAFPSTTELAAWIHEVWAEACDREGVDHVSIGNDARRLANRVRKLARCVTQMHSAVKGAACAVVTNEFGFSESVSKAAKERNRKLYMNLTEVEGPDWPPCWLFPKQERNKPTAECANVFQNRAISSFTNKTIYNTRSLPALGIQYADDLGPHLTSAHIAFNLTMIQFALSKWQEGFFEDTTFTEEVGRRIYTTHLADLVAYREETYAGLKPYTAAGQDKGKISRSAFARMAQMAGTANTDAFGSDDDGNKSASENRDAAA
ncbi:hypothetical protein BC629DRAFT_1444294 [Irpex lacteus]|nr:hypothetical protein BC629DRAFT_1444294 [Irpex lacteus]